MKYIENLNIHTLVSSEMKLLEQKIESIAESVSFNPTYKIKVKGFITSKENIKVKW